MRLQIYIILFISTISISLAQTDLKVSLFGGPDFSLLQPPSDSIDVDFATTVFGGVELLYPISDKNHIRFGSSVFNKRSTTSDQLQFNNTFVSVFANYHFRLTKHIYFFGGPQYSILLQSNTVHGTIKEDISGYDSYMSVNAGVDFQLQSRLNLGVIYEYPINNPKLATWPSLKVKLSFTIDKELFKIKEKKRRRAYSEVKLQELKKTALLVRLRGYKNQISSLEEKGDTLRVKLIKQKRDEQNRSVVNAFSSDFDYCPVYFFYNYDTKKIKNKDFKNVLLNKNLEIDSSIVFNLDTFLVGELDYTKLDSTTDFSNYGFSIKDQNFEVLPKPFPRFVSGYVAFIRKSPRAIIGKLNDMLYDSKKK